MSSFNQLPENLPIPKDDGLANHLVGMKLPSIALQATNGSKFDCSSVACYIVIYCYPMTGRPEVSLPEGWDNIPGARGCTPQSCSYRDHYSDLKALGSKVVGLSTQTTEYQKEMVDRLHLPFLVLSDCKFYFKRALSLPTFEAAGMTLLKRLTMIAKDGIIVAVHYPIFPSDSDPLWVMNYLKDGK